MSRDYSENPAPAHCGFGGAAVSYRRRGARFQSVAAISDPRRAYRGLSPGQCAVDSTAIAIGIHRPSATPTLIGCRILKAQTTADRPRGGEDAGPPGICAVLCAQIEIFVVSEPRLRDDYDRDDAGRGDRISLGRRNGHLSWWT